MRQVQLDPMTSSVRATGQSGIACLCMLSIYAANAIFAIDFEKNSDYCIRSYNFRSFNMIPQIPEYLTAFEATVQPLVAAIALGLIWIGSARMEAPAQSRFTTAGVLSAAFIAWLASAQYVGSANMYFAKTDDAVPTIVFGLMIPLMAAAIGLWSSGSIARLVAAIPLPLIVAAQIYRVAGGIFLVLWADGRLPWQFALPAGIGDVATALLAVVLAVRLSQNAGSARGMAYTWSFFGIADLVVAIAMGAMTSPGRPHLLALEAPNLLITSYPLVMIPTFAVPLALMLHGIVLWRLRMGTASTVQLAVA